MSSKRSLSAYGTGFRRRNVVLKALLAAIVLAIISFVPVSYFKVRGQTGNDRRELKESFESGVFDASFAQSGEMLKEAPLDSYLLTIHGFSAYELAIAQINSFNMLSYLDACIWSLRKVLLIKENAQDGRIYYVLGKAYFYKGSGYADLAVNYLEKAKNTAYKAGDIPEYLGMAYAGIRDYRSSVAAFSMALTGEGGYAPANPSDVLLLSIARSYLALEENDPARAYLVRCLEISKDSRTTATARLLLGGILIKNGDIAAAEAEYLKVIEENGDNAEAHYQLGELYAAGGDTTRARAEWRRVLRIDPAHGPARSRLNIY